MEEKTKCEHCGHECDKHNELGECDCPDHCACEDCKPA
jgi:hypothetical protein